MDSRQTLQRGCGALAAAVLLVLVLLAGDANAQPCPRGQARTVQGVCEACKRGTVKVPNDSTSSKAACVPAAEACGTAEVAKKGKCKACPGDQVRVTNSACGPCPAGTRKEPAGSSRDAACVPNAATGTGGTASASPAPVAESGSSPRPGGEILAQVEVACENFDLQTYCGVGACERSVPTCLSGITMVCAPGQPEPEICDGIDNDCNGLIDDGLAPLICGKGACQRWAPACVTGKPGICSAGRPQVEICNGLDDDCNGVVDDGLGETVCTSDVSNCTRTISNCIDGFVQQCRTDVGPEVCNGFDDDCDGLVDEDLGETTCGAGTCVRTVPNCLAGFPQACVSSVQKEVCNGFDDDCDGVVDNGWFNVTCGYGVCKRLMSTCVNGTEVACVGDMSKASPELCNGIDDNCDGQVDEGFGNVTCGIGGCFRSQPYCLNGTIQNICNAGKASAEVCNGKDDDCDGLVDDGLGLTTCGVGQCARTVLNCIDGKPANCTPGAAQQEICNFLDDNCNGQTDEGIIVCGEGLCKNSVRVCNGLLTQTVCSPDWTQRRVETCNGADDDCDGIVDNAPGGVAKSVCSQG